MMPDLFAWLLTGSALAERDRLLDDPAPRPQNGDLVRRTLPGPELAPADPPRPDRAGDGDRPDPPPFGRGARDLPQPERPGTGHPRHRQAAVAAVPVVRPRGVVDVVGPPTGATSARGPGPCWGWKSTSRSSAAETLKYNFTNEGGVVGTTRLLKNIMGLWLVQECRRTWPRAGREISYEELAALAEAARPFAALVDPDDESFLSPGDMPARLAAYCTKTGQTPPQDEGAFARCALESSGLKYRWTIERLERILGTTIRTIHVVGGGTRNALLCQFTADACGRPVHAGPVEATAVGNVLLQAMGRGRIGSWPTRARSSPARSRSPSTNRETPPSGTTPPPGSLPWSRPDLARRSSPVSGSHRVPHVPAGWPQSRPAGTGFFARTKPATLYRSIHHVIPQILQLMPGQGSGKLGYHAGRRLLHGQVVVRRPPLAHKI